ncbi:MAG: hypothetical protein ACI8ZB_001321 [Desulforhopalus sp.]|jgi:hypothetical protein
MKWRKLNFILHRDIGYLCVGLTIIYAISGITLNHISPSFNPNYRIEKSTGTVSPLGHGAKPDMEYIRKILGELGETGKYKNGAFLSPEVLRVFVEGNTIDISLDSGVVQMEKIEKRPIIYGFNALHLNKAKGLWTWLADIYCIALFILALSGALMIRGGQKMRHLGLTSLGLIIPTIFLFWI